MQVHILCLAILAAASLGACASRQAPLPSEPLVLAGYTQGTPPDQACVAMIGQAAERDAQRSFKLAGMLNTNTYPKPGESTVPANPQMPLVPIGSHPAGQAQLQMDGTSRGLFVNCETRQAYVAKRGGVIDITYWYGPFAL